MLKRCLSILLLAGSVSGANAAEEFATKARSALMIDAASGAVLLEKNADLPLPPASMSKLMTTLLVFEALASGRLSLNDEFLVSEKAWKMGGSKMFVKVGERVRIEDLLRGVIIQSGNDACIVLAEGLAGSEDEFARRMTRRGREIGLKNSTFMNATGWPQTGHEMSAQDLVHLAQILIEDYPEYYPLYSEQRFTWENITQSNRNPLLALGLGADGLKTGHTEEAGYGLVGSAVQGDRRLILMIAGLESASQRAHEAESLLRLGFREFENHALLPAGTVVGTVPVWIGTEKSVAVAVKQSVAMTTHFGAGPDIKAQIVRDGPARAPIAAGDEIAKLRLSAPRMDPVEFPLYATEAVPAGSFLDKVRSAAAIHAGNLLTSAFGGDKDRAAQ